MGGLPPNDQSRNIQVLHGTLSLPRQNNTRRNYSNDTHVTILRYRSNAINQLPLLNANPMPTVTGCNCSTRSPTMLWNVNFMSMVTDRIARLPPMVRVGIPFLVDIDSLIPS